MRHVSRTHRVALDWLFDRISLDSKIQIWVHRHQRQLADILTKGNFTRDEWNSLLHVSYISHFSSTCCVKNSSLMSCPKTMAKRMQEQKGEERIVSKSMPMAINLSSIVSASSSSAKDPIASTGPTNLTASWKPDVRGRRNSKPYVTSSSQVRLQDAYLDGLMERVAGKPAATDESQELWEFSESESWSNHEKEVTGKPFAHDNVTGKLVASINSENSGILKQQAGNGHIIAIRLQQLYLTWKSLFDRKKILRPKSDG